MIARRKISEGTTSLNGRIARDSPLGLMNTYQKVRLSV
jgi:hypothetical protein